MNRVKVSKEMQSRVLQNVEQHFGKKRRKKKLMMWIPTIGVVAAAILLVILLKSGKTGRELSSTENSTGTNVTTEDPGDLAAGAYSVNEHKTVQELSDAVGFKVKELTSFSQSMKGTAIQDISGKIAEINYSGNLGTICYRMTKGTADNSGIYDVYNTTKTVKVKGCNVTLNGDTGKFTLITWTDGTYAYSLYCIPGITEETALKLAEDTLQ